MGGPFARCLLKITDKNTEYGKTRERGRNHVSDRLPEMRGVTWHRKQTLRSFLNIRTGGVSLAHAVHVYSVHMARDFSHPGRQLRRRKREK